jgi:hypothetical protein
MFFLIYTVDGMRSIYYSTGFYSQFAGFGLWFMVIGFLLCTLAGIIQWRNPEFIGPQVLNGRSRIKKVTVTADNTAPADQRVHALADEPTSYPWENTKDAEIISDINKKNSDKIMRANTQKIETQNHEEKVLLQWLEHTSGNGRTFEQCLKCNNYGFINTKDTGASVTFECSDCGETFLLKK